MAPGAESVNGDRAGSTVAVVLPGGGARGAYEVGALSVLLPALEARAERVSVWCGTSVGAINAAMLASLRHLPLKEQLERAERSWREMRKQDVISPIVGRGGMRTITRALGHALGIPGVGLASVLDSSPLHSSLERWIDWQMLRRNVRSGLVEAVCVVATSVSTGDPVAFFSAHGRAPKRLDDEIRYVDTQLNDEHVRASAAIPILFPTVKVSTPRSASGHYLDGGTRLNSPIKPALQFGAEKVIVVGLEPFAPAVGRASGARAPGIADVAANVLDGLLVDQVAYDLRRLAAINSFFVEGVGTGTLNSPRAYRLARGRTPYRPIAYALVAPRRRGTIGRLAETVFERRYGGLRGLRSPNFAVISRALGGRTRSRGELLSFLLFDQVFVASLLEMGRRDAGRWLRRHPDFWCRDASHERLNRGPLDRSSVLEQQALDEFRGLHRGAR